MTYVRGLEKRTNRKTVISDAEFQEMLRKAQQTVDNFLRLRSTALLCLLRLTGKRRSEMAIVETEGVKVEAGLLKVTFTLLKKRKQSVLLKQSTKEIPVTDELTKPIIEYLSVLKGMNPAPRYFFPRTKTLWGASYIIDYANHISGKTVFNLVRALSIDVWPHLFRETVAADIIKADSSIISAFKVQRRLDLSDVRTGFNYLRRFANDIIERQQLSS